MINPSQLSTLSKYQHFSVLIVNQNQRRRASTRAIIRFIISFIHRHSYDYDYDRTVGMQSVYQSSEQLATRQSNNLIISTSVTCSHKHTLTYSRNIQHIHRE